MLLINEDSHFCSDVTAALEIVLDDGNAAEKLMKIADKEGKSLLKIGSLKASAMRNACVIPCR